MSLELAIVRYPGQTPAESAFGTLRERAGDGASWTHEVALVEHHRRDRLVIHGTIGGHFVDVNEMDHLSQPGAAKGAAAGLAARHAARRARRPRAGDRDRRRGRRIGRPSRRGRAGARAA